MGLTGFSPLSVSGRGLTSQVLNRRFPFLTHEHEGLTRRLTVEIRGGSFSKRVVPGFNLQEKANIRTICMQIKLDTFAAFCTIFEH